MATSVDEMMLKFFSICYQGIILCLFAFVSRFLIGVVGLCHFQPQQVQLPRATLHSPGAMNQLQLLLRAVRLSFVLCVFLCLGLILLSGDVELNPGPTIDDQPDLSLLVKWLEPLHDWKSFGLLLPGVTQEDITTIEEFGTSTVQGKTGLFSKWLKKYPTATWKDVLDALYKKEEYQLVKIIEDHLSGNLAIKIFRSHYASLTSIISTNLTKVTNALYAEELIPMNIVEDMLIEGIGDSKKASKLLLVITRHLESSQSRTQYLIDVCYVLVNQEHKALADISTAILHDLGCASVIAEKHIDLDLSATPDIVLQYANNLRRCYKDQPIVNADWPPRIGEDFFGRLALVEKQDSTIKDQKSAWYLLRGQVDEIIEMPENTEIQIEDILKPTETALSLRVVIDGPPGIGKTTLCRKLLNMWSHGPGELPPCQYDLVLYCPLRYSKIATATTLADLLVPCCYEAHILVEWFEKKNGEGLLIIFDGWDELSMSSRSSSFAKAIIRREQLSQCSVIVTSRSYASSSLLKMDSISRYIQVIGFRKEEIATVIIRKIQKDPELALELIEAYEEMINNQQDFDDDSSSDRINVDFKWLELCSNSDSQLAVKLINDLEVRGDVCSLCYIPLICSMVILVYCKENGSLPTTLTQLYENFILQTIKRQAEKCGKDAYDLPNNLLSLPSQLALQELCRLAYTNLVKKKMIFTSDQLKELSLSKEDYLGLITSFIEFDEKKYQFLHLSIQEFLAAWWIAKHEKKTEEVFKDHFDDDHFRMCLRFVAGLTNLEHESYEQYFNKQLELKCKKPPMYKYWNHVLPHFYQHPEVESYHESSAGLFTLRFDYIADENTNFPLLLFQLLYESKNAMLCHTLAQSINDQSLCLKGALSSLFDWLCFNYFVSNSSIKWKHLHVGKLFYNQELSIFNNTLTHISQHTTCVRLQIAFHEPYDEFLDRFLLSSFLQNIQELYCELDNSSYDLGLVLLRILSLPDLKIFHFDCNAVDSMFKTYQCEEIEKLVATKVTLKELKVIFYLGNGMQIVTSIVKGVTKSNTIKSFMVKLIVDDDLPPPPHPVPDKVLEDLLKDNYTLQALSLIIPDRLIESYPIFEINAPLTALELHAGYESNLLTHLVLANELRELFASHILIVSSAPLHFLFHPNLKSLYSPVTKANLTIDIFRSVTMDSPELAVTVMFRDGQAWFKKYEY